MADRCLARHPGAEAAGHRGRGLRRVRRARHRAVASTIPWPRGPVSVVASVLGAAAGVAVTLGLARRWQGGPGSAAPGCRCRTPGVAARARSCSTAASPRPSCWSAWASAGPRRASARSRAAATVTRALPKATPAGAGPAGHARPGDARRSGHHPLRDAHRRLLPDRHRSSGCRSSTPAAGRYDQAGWSTGSSTLHLRRPPGPGPRRGADHHACVSNQVGGDLIGTARWTGVRLAELLERGRRAGRGRAGHGRVGRRVHGRVPASRSRIDGRDALLVVGMNGRTLPAEHGFPARLVVPGLYGYVSATKWIKEIRLTTGTEQGFWIPRGWSGSARSRSSSRIDVPRSTATRSTPGTQVVGRRGVGAPPRDQPVEVSVDGGRGSRPTLGPTASDRHLGAVVVGVGRPAGEHELRVRAIDGEGRDPDGRGGPARARRCHRSRHRRLEVRGEADGASGHGRGRGGVGRLPRRWTANGGLPRRTAQTEDTVSDASPETHFDLIVIGGGPAGYGAALYGSAAGLNIAVVEMDKVGGTCLHRGCIPAKELLETAHVYRTVGHAVAVRRRELGAHARLRHHHGPQAAGGRHPLQRPVRPAQEPQGHRVHRHRHAPGRPQRARSARPTATAPPSPATP